MSVPDRKRNRKGTGRARANRKAMSPAEARMWRHLQGQKLGFAFRRQHPVLGYFLDFFCPEANLAVEVDGRAHDGDRDAKRDADLKEVGILTYRVAARDVLETEALRSCLDEIQRLCEERSASE